MGNVLNEGGGKLIESGVLGAVLLIVFSFIFFFLFRYYLPQQSKVLMEKAKLDAEVQANRDRYNQQQVDQLLALLKDDRQRFDAHEQKSRDDHAKAYETQREFFRQQAEAARVHMNQTLEAFGRSMEQFEDRLVSAVVNLEKTIERNSMMLVASAELQGVGKERVLARVEQLTGEQGLKDKYPAGRGPDDSQARRRETGA